MNKTKSPSVKTQDLGGGAICGGVVSSSTFLSDPDAYMMAYVLPDELSSAYVQLKKTGKEKEAETMFRKYARSVI